MGFVLTGWVSEEEKKDSERESERAAWVRGLGLLTVIVADLLGKTGAGIGIGYLAWKKLGLPWWILILTTLSGLSLSMYRLYQLSQKE